MSNASAPRVLICHERFLFRYGADRVFILIGQQLKALGWHVSMLAARTDVELLASFSDVIHTLPLPNAYECSDEFASRWLERQFTQTQEAKLGYDLVIHGGWPLFAATDTLRRLSPVVFFLDHGVVPGYGYTRDQQQVLALLHALRREHLSRCTHAAGVSEFIVRTQTRPDAGDLIPVRAILNGTDHLAPCGVAGAGQPLGPEFELVRNLARDHPLLLNLGRVETGTYKNTQTAIKAFQLVRSAHPRARFLVLETAENLRLGPDAMDGVVALGYPDDRTLSSILGFLSAGISLSLWEGFNLPLVELLRARVPAFALNIGAHSEVVPDQWFLSEDAATLAARIVHTINQPAAALARLESSKAEDHWAFLSWTRFVSEMLAFVGLSPIGKSTTK
jgi:glycosyltransferase involved in cell wall biosynthesis